jgi:hypothetical protein
MRWFFFELFPADHFKLFRAIAFFQNKKGASFSRSFFSGKIGNSASKGFPLTSGLQIKNQNFNSYLLIWNKNLKKKEKSFKPKIGAKFKKQG